jgi:hypothetical protein
MERVENLTRTSAGISWDVEEWRNQIAEDDDEAEDADADGEEE